MNTRNLIVIAALTLTAALPSRTAAASGSADPDGRHSPNAAAGHAVNLAGDAIGVMGYDPVSYFPEGGAQPRKGLISISTTHDGVTYRFATKAHMALFTKAPDKYLPAYGGWCAWAVGAINKRVDVDPLAYELRDGRLFLFYRDPSIDALALWRKEPAALKSKADANWPALAR